MQVYDIAKINDVSSSCSIDKDCKTYPTVDKYFKMDTRLYIILLHLSMTHNLREINSCFLHILDSKEDQYANGFSFFLEAAH
jgi:hypothetical protein